VNDEAPRPKRPRWGVRAMLWLGLAFASVITSNGLLNSGNDDWVIATFVGTIVGLAGAAYCSIRGIASGSGWLPR
jgi:purine-cytosine permease-like protein